MWTTLKRIAQAEVADSSNQATGSVTLRFLAWRLALRTSTKQCTMGWWRMAVQKLMRKVLLRLTVLLVMHKGEYLLKKKMQCHFGRLATASIAVTFDMSRLLLVSGLAFSLSSYVCWPAVKPAVLAFDNQVLSWPSAVYHMFCVWQLLCSIDSTQGSFRYTGLSWARRAPPVTQLITSRSALLA